MDIDTVSRQTMRRYFTTATILVGLMLILQIYSTWRKLATEVEVPATVLQVDDKRNTAKYYLTVRFTTVDGRSYQDETHRRSSAAKPQVGDEIRVRYLPSSPGLNLQDAAEPSTAPIGVAIAGTLFLVCAAVARSLSVRNVTFLP